MVQMGVQIADGGGGWWVVGGGSWKQGGGSGMYESPFGMEGTNRDSTFSRAQPVIGEGAKKHLSKCYLPTVRYSLYVPGRRVGIRQWILLGSTSPGDDGLAAWWGT
jgi:hypothetical protein